MAVTTRFEWDPQKAASNLRKHGVAFELAARAFTDPNGVLEQDRVQDGEERWQLTGLVDGAMLLLIVHTTRDDDEVEIIRIISARLGDRKDKRRYEEANGSL